MNKSTIFKDEEVNDRVIVPWWRWWRVRWQSILICLVRSWKTELWAIWITLLLSQYIGVGLEREIPILDKSQHIQIISLVVDDIWHITILNFYRTARDNVLFLTFPRDKRTFKKDAKQCSGLTICRITSLVCIIST